MTGGAAQASSAAASSASAAVNVRPVAPPATTALGKSDDQFRSLFVGWTALDRNRGGASAAPAVSGVSIPSRMPVDGVRLTSNFGYRSDPFRGSRRRHKGVDLAGPVGTPIYATADGVVARADWFSGYGLFIELEHGGDIQTRYGHLSRLNVAANQRVRKGDLIGFMGSTGRSTGSHLHYEVRLAGEAVDPMPYMQSSGFMLADAGEAVVQPTEPRVALGGPQE